MTREELHELLAREFGRRGILPEDVVLPLLAERDAEIEELGQTLEDLDYVNQARKTMIEQLEARIAELEALHPVKFYTDYIDDLVAERDAALADAEFLSEARLAMTINRDAWRECAEQLAAEYEASPLIAGLSTTNRGEALARFDALKAGEQTAEPKS